jgi:glycolate oxidase FAD binding subunit
LNTSTAVVYTPHDVAALSALLAEANQARMPLYPRGGGTKSGWWSGLTDNAATLSTTSLAPAIDHCAGDLVATVGAGMTLAAVNAALGRAGQWLPLDPPAADRATIGGIVATNESGPRRHKHGAPRDLIIGVEMVRADGTVARAGGKVVKNVAGYDLARMLCGSRGSLAILASATFKLAPLAPMSRTVAATTRNARACAELALAVAASPTTPSAIEVESPPHRLLIRFESTARSADVQAEAAAALCLAHGADAAIVADDEERSLWTAYERTVWGDGFDGLLVKASVLPTEVAELMDSAGASLASGRAALGVVFLRADAIGDATTWLDALRSRVRRRGGSAVVVKASAGLKGAIDPWGKLPGSRSLMQAVKARFDPNHILNPGGGPGGL